MTQRPQPSFLEAEGGALIVGYFLGALSGVIGVLVLQMKGWL